MSTTRTAAVLFALAALICVSDTAQGGSAPIDPAPAGDERAGAWRVMGYNSPMVSGAKRFWELQVPVTRKP